MTARRRPVAGAAIALLALAAACTAVKEDATTDTTVLDPSLTTVPDPAVSTSPTTEPPTADLEAVEIELLEVAELESPTAMATREGDPTLYIAEQEGRIRRIEVTTRRDRPTTFTVDRTLALDITDDVTSGGEQGLLGIAFSPDGNRLYVTYTGNDELQHLDEYEIGAERADASSRREILVVDDFAANHNGGGLTFGPDGFLYWSMGDGGGAGDPLATGQDPSDLLGAMLRIDPDIAPEDDDEPYAIPDGNPFRSGGGAPEVWTYGLRNPWRFSFDRATGDLWIADVGQGEVEEINLLTAESGGGRGANLGWSVLEGNQPFNGEEPPDDVVAPLFTYGHDGGRCSVTGGFVYRGALIPELVGGYLFADFCEGTLRGLSQRDGEILDERELGPSVESPASFGQDVDGELYVLSLGGQVFKIVAA